MNKLEREVVAIVSEITKAPEGSLQMDTDLRVALNVDSLQGLQIVAAVENRYGVAVPEDQIDIYTSPRTIAEAIRRLGGGGTREDETSREAGRPEAADR